MSTSCNSNCSSCGENCSERKAQQTSFIEKPHKLSSIQKVIGVISGKGGVGKSFVTSMLAVAFNKEGQHVAIMDADITGPSIPKAFGVHEKAFGTEEGIYPLPSKEGIDIMSINLLLEDETAPVVWRGPVIAGTVKQFWTDVIWENIDTMFVDMPPGTGDVPLTVFQSIPLDGVIIVTSPQELVSMIVEKAVNMAKLMDIPILGIIENMSYVKCPDCGKEIKIFGESHVDEVAKRFGIEVLGKVPVDPTVSALTDKGAIEEVETDYLKEAVEKIKRSFAK